MASINQLRANRANAKKSTGPKTPEGKDKVRFNALVHGLRAESAVIPGEDQDRFNQHLERLFAAWMPQDDMEESLVEQIAVTQWKLARLDRHEARIYADTAISGAELALALHRLYLTQIRLERSVSSTIADLERCRKSRLQRKGDTTEEDEQLFIKGRLYSCEGVIHYLILPQVRGLDGEWHKVPREVVADFPDPPSDPPS
jgi:hypothetical protein